MYEFSGGTLIRRALKFTAEWLVVAFVSVMAIVSTLRVLGILS